MRWSLQASLPPPWGSEAVSLGREYLEEVHLRQRKRQVQRRGGGRVLTESVDSFTGTCALALELSKISAWVFLIRQQWSEG